MNVEQKITQKLQTIINNKTNGILFASKDFEVGLKIEAKICKSNSVLNKKNTK